MPSNRHSISRQDPGTWMRPLSVANHASPRRQPGRRRPHGIARLLSSFPLFSRQPEARENLLTLARQRGRFPAVAQVARLTKLPADTPGAGGLEGDHLAMRFAEHGLQRDRCPVLRRGVPADREEVRLWLHRARGRPPGADVSIGNLHHNSSLFVWGAAYTQKSGLRTVEMSSGWRMRRTTRCPTRGGIQ